MNRPLLLCAALLLLSACNVATRATDAPQAAQAQNSPEPLFQSPTAPQATNTPNEAGTLAVMALNATEKARSEAREMLDRTATRQAKNDAYAAATETAQSPAQTAEAEQRSTANALSAALWTREAVQTTQTYVAPREAATAAVLRESTKWAAVTAVSYPLASLMGGASVLIIAMIMAYAVFAPRKEAEPIAEDQPARVVFVAENTQHPIPNPPGEYSQFLVWARAALGGAGLSYHAMVGAGKPFATNEAYQPLWEWAEKWKFSETVKGRLQLSRRGTDYCEAALNSPTPGASYDETDAPADNAHENYGRESGGGLADNDSFGILPQSGDVK